MRDFLSSARKKLFGGINLTWPKVIVAAVIAGVFTAVMAIIPALKYTSFHAIVVTFEMWILFGLLIVMNSKSNLDSGLKSFVFFLISQPLIYLLQVPFSWQGWNLFSYYKFWFIWTLLCFPMGFIGYYMKKGKWWGYLILLPLILLTAYSYNQYLHNLLFYAPFFLLITIFCALAIIFYPVLIFEDKRIRLFGVIVGAGIVIALTVINLMNPPVYSTEPMGNSEEHSFDDTYKAYLSDDRYGTAEIRYNEAIEDYLLHCDFKRAGKTVLTIEAPDGSKREYDLSIEIDTYDLKEITQ